MGFVATLKILYLYARPYRRQFALGILALFLVDLLNILPPLILKEFIDQASAILTGDKRFVPFLWMGLFYAAIAIGQGICRYFWRMFLIQSSFKTGEKLREEYFRKLQKLPPSFYHRHPIGDLMSLATNDVEAVRFAIGPGLLVFADALFFLISIPPAMLILSSKLTLISLAPMLLVPFIVIHAERLIHHRFEKVQAQFSKLSAFAQENLEGIRIIKAFVREWTQIDRFASLGKEFVRLNLKLTKSQSIFDPLFTLAIALGLVSLLLFSGSDVIAGKVGLGTFVAFTRYLDLLVWPMMAFGLAVTYYNRGKASLERILQVLGESEEGTVQFGAESTLSKIRPTTPKSEGVLFEVSHLTFTYPGQKHPALKNISFRIEKKSRTAIVGPVGCGKSTLVRLLTGLYEAPAGTIFWNGRDVHTLPLQTRRENIAIVPQDVFLFLESLRWNVLLGSNEVHPFEKPDDQLLDTLLKKAGLENEARVWSLDTPIGERGLNLSGGERARATLARALMRNSSLLILDDALSSVDSQTESKILDGLYDNPTQTLLVITHRFSRIWKFDQVLVLRDGELVQIGPPSELAHTSGLYQQLLELQRMEDELAR